MAHASPADGSELLDEGVMPEPRRVRIVRWLLEHNELDDPSTKGKLTFDLGRRPGGGGAAVAVAFHPTSEDL
jgi:hypothetical protein